MKPENMLKDETKAHLRKLWIRVAVVLIAAFGVIYLLSVLSGDNTVAEDIREDCDPPQFLCSLGDVEAWMTVTLPESARGVEYFSDEDEAVLWLRFDATIDDVTAFLDQVRISAIPGVEVDTSFVPEPAPGQLGWWQPQTATNRADLASDVRPDRFFLLQLIQDDDTRWVVYLTGVDVSEGESS